MTGRAPNRRPLSAGPEVVREEPCRACPYLRTCGGLDEGEVGAIRCMRRCDDCDQERCDNVCFGSGRLEADGIFDVGGFDTDGLALLAAEREMPHYIPNIQHSNVLEPATAPPWVAMPLHELFTVSRDSGGALNPRFESRESLARHFGLARTTKVMVVGVGEDDFIEAYWTHRQIKCLAATLALLKIDAVIPPNYSVWADDPRLQHLYNRKRSLIVGHDFSRAEVPVIPYAVGVLPADWAFWTKVFRENPELRMIVKEFGTGLRGPAAYRALDDAARMQDVLGRRLHFVAVSGFQHANEIASRFDSWTIIDSDPFMKTVFRRKAYLIEGRVQWRPSPDADQGALFAYNLASKVAELEVRVATPRQARPALAS